MSDGLVYLGDLALAGGVQSSDETFWCDAGTTGCNASVALKRVSAAQIADYVSTRPSGVVPGSYTNTNLTVDASGRVTLAASGTGGPGGGGITALTGDVTAVGIGSVAASVVRLYGHNVSPAMPSDTQVLTWSTSAGMWQPGASSAGPTTLIGDVTGSGSGTFSTTVAQIRGRPVSGVAPLSSQVLGWDGAQWLPVPPVTGGGGGAPPGGTTGQVQINVGGSSFGGITMGPTGDATWNTSTGVLTLASITAGGSFTNANITVDTKGRVTTAASGAPTGIVSSGAQYQAAWYAGAGTTVSGSANVSLAPTGGIIINRNAVAALPTAIAGTGLWVNYADTDTGGVGMLLDVYGGSANLILRRANGTPGTARSRVLNNDVMGGIASRGYDNAGNYSPNPTGRIYFYAREDFAAGAQGTSFGIATMTPTTTSMVDRMIVGPGVVVLSSGGTAPPGGDMGAGTLNSSGLFVNGNAVLLSGAGTGLSGMNPQEIPVAQTSGTITSSLPTTGTTGRTSIVSSTSAARTSGHLSTWDLNGNLVDGGAVPSGGVTSIGMTVPASSLFAVSPASISTSGTFAITTSGTSGGLPYFNTANTLNSSGALAAHGLLLGGGAGNPPTALVPGTSGYVLQATGATTDPIWASVALGGGTVNTAPAGQLTWYAGPTTQNVVSGNPSVTTGAGAAANLTINRNTAGLPPSIAASGLWVNFADAPEGGVLLLDSYATPTNFVFRRANGIGSGRTGLAQGDVIGGIASRGAWDSVNYSTTGTARVWFQAMETFTSTNQGTAVGIDTNPLGVATARETQAVFGPRGVMVGTPLAYPTPATGDLNAMRLFAGSLQINANASATPPAIYTGTLLRVVGVDGTEPRVGLDSFAANNSIIMRRANGTATSPTRVTDGQTLGQILFSGCISAGTYQTGSPAVWIGGSVNEPAGWSATQQGGYAWVSTITPGTTTVYDRMRIGPGVQVFSATGIAPGSGDMGAGTINVAGGFYVNGNPVGAGADSVGTTTGAGTNQGTANPISTQFVNVTTVGVGTGVILPTSPVAGSHALVRNSGANTLLVYPAGTNQINTLGPSVAISVLPNSTAYFEAASTTLWVTVP